MLISVNWLKKHIPDFELHNLKFLKEKLDTRLSEIESVTEKGTGLSKLVVGEIVSTSEHPTNKKLSVCEVNVGQSELSSIVCGAPNALPGLRSVVCLPGGSVYVPGKEGEVMDITLRKMGEVTSAGMLCAPDELGLSDDHTQIIEIADDIQVGQDVTDLFQDIVIEIDNKAVPHRPDVFSHLGIAREFKAIFRHELVEPEQVEFPSVSSEKSSLPLEVKIADDEHCKRFSAIVLDGIKIGPSPLWIQIALSYTGIRPINNIVDITNYVMLDIGQPLHAFDYNKLNGTSLTARMAKKNEKVTTLDGKERELETDMMVVADEKGASAVAGVMGGADSEIEADTNTIVIEAANWEMYQIRRTSRKLGLRSEASTRLEKGISPEITLPALHKAMKLAVDIAGAEMAAEVQDEYPNPQEQKIVTFDLNSVKRLTGIEVDKLKLIGILAQLGIEVVNPDKLSSDALLRPEITAEIELKIPKYRQDLHAQEDIIEEIARMYGYENVPPTIPGRDLRPPRQNRDVRLSRAAKLAMVSAGFTEIYTYTMVGEQLYKDALLDSSNLIGIPNPISPELGMVRDQILPSILTKLKQNISKYETFGMFEMGRVANPQKSKQELPQQPKLLAGVYVGKEDLDTMRRLKAGLDYLSKEVTSDNLIVAELDKKGTQQPYYHPGKTGEVVLDGQNIGEVGIIHPMVIEKLGLEGSSVAAFQLDFDQVVAFRAAPTYFKDISNYQPVIRDLSFWFSGESRVGDYMATAQHLAKIPDVAEVNLIDVYSDSKSDKTSVTLRFVLQSLERTLSQDDIQTSLESVIKLAKDFDMQLRD